MRPPIGRRPEPSPSGIYIRAFHAYVVHPSCLLFLLLVLLLKLTLARSMESKAQHHDGVTSSRGPRPKTPSPRPLAAVVGQNAAFSCDYSTYRFFRAMALAGHQNAHSLERILSKRKRQLVALEPAVPRLHAGGKRSLSSAAAPVLADWTSSALVRDSGDAATATPEVDLSLRLCSSSITAPEVDLSRTTAPEVDLSLRLWSGPRSTTGRGGDVTQPRTGSGSRRRKNQAEKI
ncbi:hypothetical protein VPH35_092122 [Triticum aestivum]|uniref:Uncharacterized protein n=1 Tax=Triticum aestivum TaxID=4565 RepID=A0A3B6LS89_WHEAT